MRRIWPPIVLIFMTFLVAELLPGSAPITQPALWPFLLLIYGPGALIIRESVRRTGGSWESILLLGVSYGLIEEGLALQSLFNPTLYQAAAWGGRAWGINGIYAEASLTIHAIWSAAVPILLTDLLFPSNRDRPYLNRLGLGFMMIWYLLGVGLLALIARTSIAPDYRAPPSLLVLTAALAGATAIVALVLPSPARLLSDSVTTPTPCKVMVFTFIASLLWHALLALLWRVVPEAAMWPWVFVPMVGALAIALMTIWALRRWSTAAKWNDVHRLAIASGAILSHSLVGAAILTRTKTDRIGVGVLGILAIVLLSLFAGHVGRRVTHESIHSALFRI